MALCTPNPNPEAKGPHLWNEEGLCVHCKKEAWELKDPGEANDCPGPKK